LAQREARLNLYLKALDSVMDDYERDNPHRRAQAILWLLESGFQNLRQAIKSPHSEASWEQTIIEYHYPVNWDWSRKITDRTSVHYGKISGCDSKGEAAKNISRIIVETIIQTTLQDITNGVAWWKKGEGYRRLLPEDILEAVETVRGRVKRETLVEDLYRPWSMGATDFGIDETVVEQGGRLSKNAQRELQAATRRMVPAPKVEFMIDGHPITLTTILQVHPLVVDVGETKAYYPITVGFNLVPKARRGKNIMALMAEPWAQPAKWEKKDQDDFWSALFERIHAWGEELKPAKPAPVEEAVLTISAKLKIPFDPANKAGTHAAIDKIQRQLRKAGHVVEMQHAWSGAAAQKSNFTQLWKEVNAARNPAAKGKTLETLVAALFDSVEGFTVKKNQRTDSEEIDLVVVNGSHEARWRNGTPLILVECKNWSEPCDKNALVQFRDKLMNRYGQCRLGFLVSWGGFACTVTKDVLRNSKADTLIVPLEMKHLKEACMSGEVSRVLCEAWDAAVLT
jgi:hypothetical protein